MKKKLTSLLITTVIIAAPAFADFAFMEESDFTGEAFFTPATSQPVASSSRSNLSSTHTIPPLKLIRLKVKDSFRKNREKKFELAPTMEDVYNAEVVTTEADLSNDLSSIDEKTSDEFATLDDDVLEQENQKKKKRFFGRKKKNVPAAENKDIILDCDNIDYDTQNYLVKAKGNVSVNFVKQGAIVKADTITFDRLNNTVMADGNVKILKNGQTITGEYIFVDMNEENALIENPSSNNGTIEIKSNRGYVYTDKIVQEAGSIVVKDSFPVNFHSANRGPQMRKMLIPKNDTITEDMSKGIIKLQAKDIKIKQKGDLETISITRMRLFKGDKIIFRTPSIKIYTNKNHDFAETNHFEIGAYRSLGLYAGPGVVFELPKGAVFKAMPILNYKSGLGFGGYGRFSSGTNQTMLAYGSAAEKMVVLGKQRLDDNLNLQYGMNAYMDEWFLGRRRPKYGINLNYKKSFSSSNFLLKGQMANFTHRADMGYYQDLDFDKHFVKIKGADMGTLRARYMAMGTQNLYSYKDEENLKAFTLALVSQMSSAMYGNGDTQIIGRIGPRMHMQYKRWMQDIGYFASAYDDNSPMPVFDAYRYGKQNLYIREYIKICKYLTLSWFGSINLSDDAPNGKDFQENSFYVSVGPDDLKLNLGYDFVRENLYCTIEVMMDAKGTSIEYDSMEIKQDKKAKKEDTKKDNNVFKSPETTTVLQKAIVENIKVKEDVL